jgi:signal transduction histidine kinase
VQQHPVVYWGADPQWPPFSSFDKRGRITGIDVDIVKLIGARTGLHLEFVPTQTWSETLDKASKGEIDFVGGIARTEERERLRGLRFTEVFCDFPTAIVTRKDMPFMTSMHELSSERIAMPKDYATTEELERLYPEAHIVLTDNEEQSMLAVAEDAADATALNLASACYIVHMRGLINLKISGFTEIDFFLSLAVKSGSTELHSILEKGLATIGPREKEEIFANYITPATRNEINWKLWRSRLIYSALAGTLAVAGVLLWNRVLAREIGRRRAAEALLRQANERLEERGRQLDNHAQQMETLNRKLTSANQDLEAFSYSVSHDLKAPLRRMRNFAEIVQMTAENLDSVTQKAIREMQREGKRMDDLIEALLALARVGSAQLHLSAVNLDDLTREVINELQAETRGRELKWEVQSMPTVECYRPLMKQALVNLLANAVKFTRGRTPALIEIGMLPVKPGGPELVLFVKDNGAGFEKKKASELFEAFHRLHRYEEYEGSGIGLATLKRIIQKHGGRVWAEGEVNRGATFYFSLPRDPAKETREQHRGSDAVAAKV